MSAPRSWRTPAVVLTCGSLILFLTLGTRAGFGLYLEPVTQALGTGRGMFAFAIAAQNLIWGLAQPFTGAIADRFGSGRVICVGGLCYVLGLVLMSQATDIYMFNLGAGFFVGVGLAGASLGVVFSAVARVVPPEKRSWAFGVGTAVSSLGQFVMVPIGQSFLSAYGWSGALLLVSLCALLIVPLAAALVGRPVGIADLGPEQSLAEALGEAWRHSGFRYLTLGFFVCGFHVVFIATHLPAYITDAGLPGEVGAWAIAVVGLFNIIGSYSSGVLGGRYSKRYLLTWIYFARAVVIAIFIVVPLSTYSVLIFAAAMGLLWLSTVPATSALVVQIFGPRYMATLFGIVFLSHQLGSFLGAWLGGVLYDRTGSYDLVWYASIALGIGAALLHMPIDERPVARLAAAE